MSGLFFSSSGVPSLGSLSGSLVEDYRLLPPDGRRLFLRAYRSLWQYLVPLSGLEPLGHYSGLPVVLNSLSPRLTVHTFCLFSRLYVLSGAGARAVDLRGLSLHFSDRARLIPHMIKNGLLTRSFFDPSYPHLLPYRHVRPVFLSLTGEGVAFYRLVLSKLREHARKEQVQYMEHQKEKGQTR